MAAITKRIKPEPIPNVWTDCLLQVIPTDGTNKWKTVGRCLWTPNAIKSAVADLKAKGIVNVWVKSIDGRQPTF